MSGIFISYRRDDSAPSAGRLGDRLSARFGADRVFMDVDDIPPGADFAAHIGAKIGDCDALLAVIGKQWLTSRNSGGQFRLGDPDDLVSREIALALQRRILVIPVLVEGASMPKADELRSDLKPLAQRNAVRISDHDFQSDVAKLIKALEALPGLRNPTPEPADQWKADLRQRLRRRLVWKIPLIVLLVSFAAWWQWQKDAVPPSSNAEQTAADKTAAAVVGIWKGDVTYPWGDKYSERFLFNAEGAKLFGIATFLASKRAIEEGQITGATILFKVRYEEVAGGDSHSRLNRYEGKLLGDEIRLRVFDDKGSPPVEFNLIRSVDGGTAADATQR